MFETVDQNEVKFIYCDVNYAYAVIRMGYDHFTYDRNEYQVARQMSRNSYMLSYDADDRSENMQAGRLVNLSGTPEPSFVLHGDGNRVKGMIGPT